ncbi:MAG: folate family ECF transporter S component [Pyramidobacter sp.]|jgi:ECF transporter S component (folate family)
MVSSKGEVRENRWLQSLKEFKSLRTVTFCGVMCALAVIISSVATIKIGPYVKVGFSGLPNHIVEFLFGPAVGALFSGVLEVLKYMLHPDGPYFVGFTISAVLGGIIFGSMLYRRPLTLWRVIVAEVIVKVVVNLGLNTLWLAILYRKAIWVIFPARLTTNLIRLPVDVIIMYLLLKTVQRVVLPIFSRKPA